MLPELCLSFWMLTTHLSRVGRGPPLKPSPWVHYKGYSALPGSPLSTWRVSHALREFPLPVCLCQPLSQTVRQTLATTQQLQLLQLLQVSL